MKKLLFVLISLTVQFQLISQNYFVQPTQLKADNYPGHVELNWNNSPGFTYTILRSFDVPSKFIEIAETNQGQYFDFLGKTEKTNTVYYRIVPKGLSLKDQKNITSEIVVERKKMRDEDLLDMTQRYTTRYFFDFAEPTTGMARERSNDVNGDIVTTGGTGFGIMSLIAAIERKYITPAQGLETVGKIVSFLEKTELFHGAWAHWYDANTLKAFSFSKFDDGGDLVETAFLVQGLLTAREYFKKGEATERILANRITQLWQTVEWDWYTQGTDSLYWHWSKNYGWKMNHRIKGFDETLITYILAASSPTYPIKASVYESCYKKSTYYFNGKSYYGIKLDLGMEYGGPLFFTHYSFLGLNPTGLRDNYTNYFDRNRAHVLIHRAYAIENPKKQTGYGPDLWGFTSSDDPKVGYTSHHPGTDDENGTVSPTAAISSIVYSPKESMQVLKYLYFEKGKQVFGKYGFYDAYNPGMVEGQQVVRSYLAIDQGPIAVMIENYRSALLWNLFMNNPEIQKGLNILGFRYTKN